MLIQIILQDTNGEGLSISESPFNPASENRTYFSSTELDKEGD